MNIYKLRKRYRKSDKEITRILTNNLERMGSYAKFQYGAWEIDEKGLSILDDIMGYKEPSHTQNAPATQKQKALAKAQEPPAKVQEPAAEQKKDVPSKKETTADVKPEAQQPQKEPAAPVVPDVSAEQKAKKAIEDEKDARIKELMQQVEEARNFARKYAAELDNLQEKFISVQNGSDALNSSLIRKHQLRAEVAEQQLSKLQKDSTEKNRLKLERIKELEGRIEEMQSKLVENHDELEKRQQELFEANEKLETLKKESTERCSQAELKVLNSKKNEDKLYRDLHKSEERISELNQKVIVAGNERTDALRQMSAMRGQITDLKSQLIAIVAHLNEYLTDKETIPDAAGKTVEPPKEQQVTATTAEAALPPHPAPAVQPEPQPTVVKAEEPPIASLLEEPAPAATEKPTSPEITLSLQQNELMERLRKEQQKEKAEQEEPKGFFSKIFGKAAGFF